MDLDGIFVEEHGWAADEPPIVLVHGAPDRSASFRHVVARLSDRNVVVYDRRGYGRSLGATPPTTMTDHAHDLLAILDGIGAPGVVVAHSFGSNPAMLAATLRPEAFAALGVWEPPLVWTDDWPQSTKDYNVAVARSADPTRAIDRFYRHVLGDDGWEGLADDARARHLGEAVAFQADMASEIATPFAFDDVVVPALVGYGTETRGGHVEGARWLVEALPDARLHAVDGVGHFAPRTHPDHYAAFVRAAAALAP